MKKPAKEPYFEEGDLVCGTVSSIDYPFLFLLVDKKILTHSRCCFGYFVIEVGETQREVYYQDFGDFSIGYKKV